LHGLDRNFPYVSPAVNCWATVSCPLTRTVNQKASVGPFSMTITRKRFYHRKLRTSVVSLLLLALALSHAGCFLNEKLERYYGRVVVPREQKFNWSDGGLPQTFDPAFAAAPPDTDLVRAIFEGLTDYDPHSLTPVPAVALRWETSNSGRVWTFYLRDDAR